MRAAMRALMMVGLKEMLKVEKKDNPKVGKRVAGKAVKSDIPMVVWKVESLVHEMAVLLVG